MSCNINFIIYLINCIVVDPLKSDIKIQVTPSPDKMTPAFSSPKSVINFSMDELSLRISEKQYQDLIPLIDSVENLLRSRYYRKFRPPELSLDIDHHQRMKELWKFAFNSVLD